MMQEKKLEDLIWDLQRELRGLGLAMPTVTEYSRLCSKIQRLHELRGLEHFDRDVVSEFVADIERRNEDGTLGKSQYGLYLRAARILTEFHDKEPDEQGRRALKNANGFVAFFSAVFAALFAAKIPNRQGRLDDTRQGK